MMFRRRMTKVGFCTLQFLLAVSSAHALESIDDGDLSNISGQSGVTLDLVANSVGSSSSNLTLTTVDPSNSANNEANLFQGFYLSPIGSQGAVLPSTAQLVVAQTIDAGANGTTPAVQLSTTWSRMRAQSSAMSLLYNGAAPAGEAYAFGAAALDASGNLTLTNTNGLLSTSAQDSVRQASITLGSPQLGLASPSSNYAQLYFRIGAAGSPEVVFDNMYLQAGFGPSSGGGSGGVMGVCLPAACNPLGGASTGFGATQNGGLYIGANAATAGNTALGFNANWVIKFRSAPTTGFTTVATDADPGKALVYYGWTGTNYSTTGTCPGVSCVYTFTGLTGGNATSPSATSGGFTTAELLIGGGGIWSDTGSYLPNDPVGRSQGVNFKFQGNFDNYFSWIIGEPAAGLIDFSRWATLPGATWGLSAPNITYDVVNTGEEAGGLCWGGQAYGVAANCTGSTNWVNGRFVNASARSAAYLDLPPQNTALALLFRNLSLQAYSQAVTILDALDAPGDFGTFQNSETIGGSSVPENKTEQWALVYTLGQVDGNLYFYPGNKATGSTGNGVTADILFMTQSFASNTANAACTGCILPGNTNLMIADTGLATPLGFGILQANALLAAKGLNFTFTPVTGSGATANGGIGLSATNIRFELEGLIGGGPFGTTAATSLTANNLEKLAYGDINIESPLFTLNIFPGTYTDNFSGGVPTSRTLPYMGLSGFLRFGDTSSGGIGLCGDVAYTGSSCTTHGNFLSLQEPSQTASLDIDNVTGDICLGSVCSASTPNGLATGVYFFSAADSSQAPDQKARLTVASTIQIGSTIGASGGNCGGMASAGACQPLTGEVRLSNSFLGSVMIPSGQIYSQISLKPLN